MLREPSSRTPSKGRARLARAIGLLVVLGLPLAAVSPVTDGAPSRTLDSAASAPAASAAEAAAPSAPAGVQLDGYTAATPRTGASEAPATPAGAQADDVTVPGATPVTSIVDDPRCGKGFTSVQVTGKLGFGCIHSVHDPLPPISTPMAQSAKAAAPVCLGNGVNGPRIQLIYMYVEGQPNRAGVMVPKIANEIVPRMEGVFRETSKLQGREVGMRLHMPGCKLAVDTVMIDSENGTPDDPGKMLTRVTDHLVASGYDSTDRKYIVWLDAGNKGACGVAPAYTSLLERGMNPTPTAMSNIGWQQPTLVDQGLAFETALVFRYGVPVLGSAPNARECWGQGGTGARTEIHELLHNIGAVNVGSPNSNGFGHCTDDHDIMCYGEQGVSTVPRCATPVEQLDCGADDYFNARPSAGSYLSTHWNTANSKFLGDAVVHDAIPADVPRP